MALRGEKRGQKTLGRLQFFIPCTYFNCSAVFMSACLSPRVERTRGWICTAFFTSKFLSSGFFSFLLASALSLSLLCPALLLVLQRTRLSKLSHFRNCWLLWEWVCVFECAHRAPVVSSEHNSGLLCLFWGFSRRWKRIKWPCCKSDKGIYFVCKHSKQMMTSGYGMVFWMLASSLH